MNDMDRHQRLALSAAESELEVTIMLLGLLVRQAAEFKLELSHAGH